VNIKNNLNGVESASIGLSVLGSIAAAVTQQVAYVATPLTLALSVSLINRQKQLITAEQRLANLEHQLVALPTTPTTVDFYRLSASVSEDRAEVQRLGTLLTEIEQRSDDLSPFLTEIDLTKDSLKQLSLNLANFEQEFHNSKDSTRVTSVERGLLEIAIDPTFATLSLEDRIDRLDSSPVRLSQVDLDRDEIYLLIVEVKQKLQSLEANSRVAEDSIRQVGWRFLELEKAFADRQDPLDILNLHHSISEIGRDLQSLGLEFSQAKDAQISHATELELERTTLHASIAATKQQIQLLTDNAISADLIERVNDLDTSLGDLHDYNLKLTNRIDNYTQYEIVEIISAAVSEQNFSNLIQQEIEEQFEVIKQVLPKQYAYTLVPGRAESRQIFLDALTYSQERLILVCPWLTDYSVNQEVWELIKAALDRGVSIEIGWGHLKDVKNNRSKLSKEKLLKSSDWAYNAIPDLYELQNEYPDLLKLKILGTHEKFLVCDRQFAMLGSHNYLTSDTKSSEREIGIKTDSPELIDGLIKIFDRAQT
jgi:hypothetical protein